MTNKDIYAIVLLFCMITVLLVFAALDQDYSSKGYLCKRIVLALVAICLMVVAVTL